MIEGFNIRCTVGGLEVLRSPRIVLTLRRREPWRGDGETML